MKEQYEKGNTSELRDYINNGDGTKKALKKWNKKPYQVHIINKSK